MRLSTKGRYGTRALLDIAIQSDNNPVPLKDIAARQEISVQYLEQLIGPLISAGIARSVRGSKGGITLAKPPEAITLREVIRALEGAVGPTACTTDLETCPRSDVCAVREVWKELGEAMNEVLESTTLLDLVERQKRKNEFQDTMYYI